MEGVEAGGTEILCKKLGLVRTATGIFFLIKFYGTVHSFNDTHELFDEIPEPNVISWNTVIATCASKGNVELGFILYRGKLLDLPVLLPHSQGNGTLMTWRAFFSDLFDKALKVKQREGKHWPINWTKHLWD